jgi:hypothetical protein
LAGRQQAKTSTIAANSRHHRAMDKDIKHSAAGKTRSRVGTSARVGAPIHAIWIPAPWAKGRDAIRRDSGASIADMRQYSPRSVIAVLSAGNGARR